MVNMTNGSYIYVRLCPLKFFFGHSSPLLAMTPELI
jgi:hypothetical protein